jgi:hypothetical protein
MPISPIDQLAALATSFQSVLVNSFVPFEMKDLASQDFPYTEYTTNIARYKSAVDWFTGEALEPNDPQSKVPEAYPIRINPINGTCLKHGYALFGETNNDSRPLVVPGWFLMNLINNVRLPGKLKKLSTSYGGSLLADQ